MILLLVYAGFALSAIAKRWHPKFTIYWTIAALVESYVQTAWSVMQSDPTFTEAENAWAGPLMLLVLRITALAIVIRGWLVSRQVGRTWGEALLFIIGPRPRGLAPVADLRRKLWLTLVSLCLLWMLGWWTFGVATLAKPPDRHWDSRVHVVTPEGEVGTVPLDRVEAALDQGYRFATEQEANGFEQSVARRLANLRREEAGIAAFVGLLPLVCVLALSAWVRWLLMPAPASDASPNVHSNPN